VVDVQVLDDRAGVNSNGLVLLPRVRCGSDCGPINVRAFTVTVRFDTSTPVGTFRLTVPATLLAFSVTATALPVVSTAGIRLLSTCGVAATGTSLPVLLPLDSVNHKFAC